MPSIWVKTAATWDKILSAYVKTSNAGFTELLSAWVKTVAIWDKVFDKPNVPGIITYPKVRDWTGNNNVDNVTYIANIGDTLYGYRGTWSYDPTGYTDNWQYSAQQNGIYSNFPVSETNTTLDSSAKISEWDDYWIVYVVKATNATGTSDWVTSSNQAHFVKYQTSALNLPVISGTTSSGQILTVTGTGSTYWSSTLFVTNDRSPSSYTYRWLYSDGTPPGTTYTNSTYLITDADVGKQMKVEVTAYNSNPLYTASLSINTAIIISAPIVYNFAMGNTLYLSTNGSVGLDSGFGGLGIPPSGRHVFVYGLDLINNSTKHWSNSTDYVIQYNSFAYNQGTDPAYNLKYQIKFSTLHPTYALINIINKGASLAAPSLIGYYENGALLGAMSGPYFIGTGSTYKINFNSTAGTTSAISFTAISEVLFLTDTTSQDDDTFYTLVTGINQQAANLAAPTITSVTSGYVGSPASVYFGLVPGVTNYQMYWHGFSTAPASAVTPDASGTSSPLIDSSGPSIAGTFYAYVRSVVTVGDNSLGPSPTVSAWSAGYAFTVSNLTAPSLTASTTDPTKITLTWSGGVGDAYQIYYNNGPNALQPTEAQTIYDFSSTSSPLDVLLNTPRNIERRFWIRAVSGTAASPTGKSIWSPAITSLGIYGYMPLYAPQTPTSPTISGVSTTNITFSWTAPTTTLVNDIAASYDYFTSTTNSIPANATGNTALLNISFAYTASTTPVPQYFWVKARNTGGVSSATSVVSTTPTALVLYTITFDSLLGSAVAAITQTSSGSSIAKPTDPTRTSYAFGGWSTSSGGTVAVSWPRTPSNSHTLYAIWLAVPGAPTIGAASITSTTVASLTFTAPVSDGGSAITGYTITSSPAITITTNAGTTSPRTATGTFASGVAYTFTIRAINSVGTSLASSASNSITPNPAASPTVTSASYIPLGNQGTLNQVPSSGSVDDGYFTITLPFATKFNGVYYSTVYIGTNSYATFGGGSSAYLSLSGTIPAFDKVMVYAADRGSNSVYFYSTGSGGVWNIKYNGSNGTAGGTDVQWELYASAATPTVVEVTIVAIGTGIGVRHTSSSTGTIWHTLGGAGTAWRITSQ